MNCRRCNTPIPSRSSSCPNCGQHVGAGEAFIDDPGDSGVQTDTPAEGLMSPSPLARAEPEDVEVDLDEDMEVDLDDAVEVEVEELSLDEAVAMAKPTPRPVVKPPAAAVPTPIAAQKRNATSAAPNRARKAAAPSGGTGGPSGSGGRSKGEGRSASPVAPSSSHAPPPPDVETVRAILAEHPELIEPGLEVLSDETGREIGVRHATEVGVIDLLARDESGALVAIMVTGSDSGSDVVGEALHRLGWVRKHLAKNGENVRGIVLIDRLEDDMAYAAAAVSGTLRFKSYALSLSLSDIDV